VSDAAGEELEHATRRASEITSWDDHADVVVVGYGCAGASAAIGARSEGVDTLVLERSAGGGGTSATSGGLIYLGGGTATQKLLGFEDSPEDMFNYLMAAMGPDADESLVGPYAEHSVAHYDWLVEQGVEFGTTFFPDALEPPGDDGLTYSGSELCHPFREIARPAPRGHAARVVGSKGAKLMQALLGSAERLGVRQRTGVVARRLVVESDGRVCGVVVHELGEERCIRARSGVVLTSGGFIWNDEMLARYAPQLLRGKAKVGTETDDGSGIRMGMAAGGAAIHMSAGDITLAIFPPVKLKQGLYVDRVGQRYLNEDAYFGRAGEHALLHHDGHIYLIVDDECFAQPVHYEIPVAAVAESIEELESELGMPTGSLQHTVSFYNEHAAKGEDPLFHKQPEWLRPLDRPPFGAMDLRVENAVYSVFTLGGLHIDANGSVRNPSGQPIPGLFAAGRTTSCIAKQGYSSGISLGDGSFFGRRAGRSAAGD
jgi:succinate dehydrogenase/fumarate reductase flavoprotein subunit